MSRDQWIKFRVTREEKACFEAKASLAGMTVADLIRHRILRFRIRKNAYEQERIRMLARIGNNLNQLARWANSYKGGLDTVRVVSRLETILRELRKEP